MKRRPLGLAMGLAVLMGSAPLVLAKKSPHKITANVGVVSNYTWRGTSQTDDGFAVQVGIDYAHSSGFYLGTWVSNIDWGEPDPDYELDLYGGYRGKVGAIRYDLSTVYYAYPDADADFWEIGASGTWKVLTAGVYYTVDGEVDDGPFTSGDLYRYGPLEFDLPLNFAVSGTFGYYGFADTGSEGGYAHWMLSLSKDFGGFGTVSMNYDQNDGDEDEIVATDGDAKFWIGWLKEF